MCRKKSDLDQFSTDFAIGFDARRATAMRERMRLSLTRDSVAHAGVRCDIIVIHVLARQRRAAQQQLIVREPPVCEASTAPPGTCVKPVAYFQAPFLLHRRGFINWIVALVRTQNWDCSAARVRLKFKSKSEILLMILNFSRFGNIYFVPTVLGVLLEMSPPSSGLCSVAIDRPPRVCHGVTHIHTSPRCGHRRPPLAPNSIMQKCCWKVACWTMRVSWWSHTRPRRRLPAE
jgi:hypothetical protein